MASFNKVILIGNLTADPEIRQTNNGMKVCTFSIAINRRGKDGGVDFINIVAWKEKAEFVTQWFKKGKPILVCGQLQQRQWTDKNGGKRYEYEVLADEVTFVAAAEPAFAAAKTEPLAKPETPAEKAPIPYIPEGYGKSVAFEEVPEDGDLPF